MSTWRIAASTILRNDAFEVLMLKRGKNAKFMPNSYVFPGGILEPKIDSLFPENKTNYDDSSPGITLNMFEKDLPLRIAAARELFEEAGLLLTYNPNTRESKAITSDDDQKLQEWRTKVRNNPKLFSELFGKNLYLDVDSLVPWSNWLTPLSYKKRFDTVFFVVPLKGSSSTIEFCKKEMEGAEWNIPSKYIEKSCNNDNELFALPPPQFYELARLRLINSNEPEQLEKMTNSFKICPQIVFNKDKPGYRITLLPGDHLFNWDKKYEGLKIRELTDKELSLNTKLPIHRITFNENPIYTNLELHIKNIDKMEHRPHLFNWIESYEEERQRLLHELLDLPGPRKSTFL